MSNAYDLKIDQLCNLIGLECKYSPSTVRKVLDATYSVILKQLELNKRIYFLDFGAFEIYERPSGDRVIGDFVNGGTKIQYVPERNRVIFKMADPLDRAVNEGGYIRPSRKKKYKKSQAKIWRDYYERNKMVDKPTTEELVSKALNVSKARAEDKTPWEIRQAKRK